MYKNIAINLLKFRNRAKKKATPCVTLCNPLIYAQWDNSIVNKIYKNVKDLTLYIGVYLQFFP